MNNKYAVMIIWESGLSSSVSVEALNPAESKNKVLNQLSASVKSSILSIESKIDNQLLANKEVWGKRRTVLFASGSVFSGFRNELSEVNLSGQEETPWEESLKELVNKMIRRAKRKKLNHSQRLVLNWIRAIFFS
jgi:hypothetical protein